MSNELNIGGQRRISWVAMLLAMIVLQALSLAQPASQPATQQTRGAGQRPRNQVARDPIDPNLPTLWIIGDSTVRQGADNGDIGQWGWGNPIYHYFDTTKLNVQNRAVGGTSSRTFYTGQWIWIVNDIKPGDYLILQFGHNDDIQLNDAQRARGTIKGNGEETEAIDNMLTKLHEVVHTYGWYLRKFISEAKEKGAVISIVCSPIPRNSWRDGKIGENEYGRWAEEAATQMGMPFLNLHKLIREKYMAKGQQKVTDEYFPQGESTHTSWAGAVTNAESVIDGLRNLNSPLVQYLRPEAPKDLKNPGGRAR